MENDTVFWMTFALFALGMLSHALLAFIAVPVTIVLAIVSSKSSLIQALTAFILGWVCGLAPSSLVYHTAFYTALPLTFMVYMSSMCVAHMFEYLFVCAFHYKELKWDSYLINQSNAYAFSAVFSWVEFYFEQGLLP